MVATLPGRTQGLGLITEPLLRDLHLSQVTFAGQNLWATLIGSLFSLACGPLIDRFGSRAALTVILLALGATVLFMSRVTTANGLLLCLTLTRGLGQSALSVASLAIVGKWFSRKLPLAMGLYSLLVGIGFTAAFPGVFAATHHVGWRTTWSVMGRVLCAALAPMVWLLARRTPESIGLTIDGADTIEALPAAEERQSGFTLREALATPAFWAYALAACVFGLTSSGLLLYNESVLRERGLDQTAVTIVLALIAFSGMSANFLGGWLASRWPIGRLMAVAMFLMAIGLLLLPLGHGRAVAFVYAILMGTAAGIVTVAFFVCWGKVFGRRHLGAIQGAAQALTVLSSAAGPLLLALSVERYHGTTPLFYASAPVVALLGIACALVREPVIETPSSIQTV